MKHSLAIALVLVALAHQAHLTVAAGPKVIIVGAGMSGEARPSFTTANRSIELHYIFLEHI
jgi:hypothetical protein